MKEQPRIRIDDVNKIRIVVCHLLYSSGCPLNRDQLIEITSLEQAVNYFDLMEALDGITGRLCTCQEVNGIPVYSNTRLGDAAAREFGSELPQSIREKMFEEAVKGYFDCSQLGKSEFSYVAADKKKRTRVIWMDPSAKQEA